MASITTAAHAKVAIRTTIDFINQKARETVPGWDSMSPLQKNAVLTAENWITTSAANEYVIALAVAGL
jgi:hypothetical protein